MKREPRNGLRPVTVKMIYHDSFTGYFHMFGIDGDTQDGMGTHAVIELEDGKVTTVDPTNIKFDDV